MMTSPDTILKVINAKTKPGHDALASFGPVLGTLTHEDFSTMLQPSLEKALKKSPAGVLQALVAMTSQVGGMKLLLPLLLLLPPLPVPSFVAC